MSFRDWHIDAEWSLFLDRDGVINRKKDHDYVKSIDELDILPGALEAIAAFSGLFKRVFIVTNQQCIGKGIITHEQLAEIHDELLDQIEQAGGRIDKVYYAPQLASENSEMRKPRPGMAFKAKEDFEDVDLTKSIMVGDSLSDIQMGKNAGMKTVFIAPQSHPMADVRCDDLPDLQALLTKEGAL